MARPGIEAPLHPMLVGWSAEVQGGGNGKETVLLTGLDLFTGGVHISGWRWSIAREDPIQVVDGGTILCLTVDTGTSMSVSGTVLAAGHGEHLVECLKLVHLEHGTGRD